MDATETFEGVIWSTGYGSAPMGPATASLHDRLSYAWSFFAFGDAAEAEAASEMRAEHIASWVTSGYDPQDAGAYAYQEMAGLPRPKPWGRLARLARRRYEARFPLQGPAAPEAWEPF